jgi:hypothetical protein
MEPEKRAAVIDQLDRSFIAMPNWVKASVKHAMGAPKNHPETGEPFTSFRQVIEVASDETLETLLEEFEDNGDLLPPESAPS